MEIEEAKRLYFLYNGDTFGLFRDGYYNDIKKCVSKDILEEWNQLVIDRIEKYINSDEISALKIMSLISYCNLNISNDRKKRFILNYFNKSFESYDDFSKLIFLEILVKELFDYCSENKAIVVDKITALIDRCQSKTIVINNYYILCGDYSKNDYSNSSINQRAHLLLDRMNAPLSLQKKSCKKTFGIFVRNKKNKTK